MIFLPGHILVSVEKSKFQSSDVLPMSVSDPFTKKTPWEGQVVFQLSPKQGKKAPGCLGYIGYIQGMKSYPVIWGLFHKPMEIRIRSLNNHLEPQTTSLKRMFGETTISYVKIGFIIQLIAKHLLMVGLGVPTRMTHRKYPAGF